MKFTCAWFGLNYQKFRRSYLSASLEGLKTWLLSACPSRKIIYLYDTAHVSREIAPRQSVNLVEVLQNNLILGPQNNFRLKPLPNDSSSFSRKAFMMGCLVARIKGSVPLILYLSFPYNNLLFTNK